MRLLDQVVEFNPNHPVIPILRNESGPDSSINGFEMVDLASGLDTPQTILATLAESDQVSILISVAKNRNSNLIIFSRAVFNLYSALPKFFYERNFIIWMDNFMPDLIQNEELTAQFCIASLFARRNDLLEEIRADVVANSGKYPLLLTEIAPGQGGIIDWFQRVEPNAYNAILSIILAVKTDLVASERDVTITELPLRRSRHI